MCAAQGMQYEVDVLATQGQGKVVQGKVRSHTPATDQPEPFGGTDSAPNPPEVAIIAFAREFDPQPFHLDHGKGRESIFGGLIASSLHTLAACTRVVMYAQKGVAVMSGLGFEEVKMFNPVRPGDMLTVNAWWTDRGHSKRASMTGDSPHCGATCATSGAGRS